ncbi:MAG: hypothetical protein IJ892_02270 [Prevotella sp.]|nr:hypothetical protein [Prevotella sp.]
MESKKINYKKPAMQVVKIQHQGHLLAGTDPQGSDSGGGNAREQRSNWDSED